MPPNATLAPRLWQSVSSTTKPTTPRGSSGFKIKVTRNHAQVIPLPRSGMEDGVGGIMMAFGCLSGDTNFDPLRPVLIPTPIMLSCYRFLPPLSGSFSVFTSGSRWVLSGSVLANLDRIKPLLRFSRKR